MTEQNGGGHTLEIEATVVLALGTVATAWAAYQRRRES
jgi:hypothetical protein